MVIVLLLWTLAVAGVWWFADAVLAFVTPGAAWLAANPDLGGWIEPVLGFLGTLGAAGAVILWLVGVLLIVLFGRGARQIAARRQSISYEDWQSQDGGPPPRSSRWRRRERNAYDDDEDRRYRRR